MSELPKGWKVKLLGDLIELNKKFKDVPEDTLCGFVPMGLIPVSITDKLRYEEKYWSDCRKGYTHFKDGDVLLAKITPCFENGKSALVEGLPNGIGSGSTEFFVMRPLDIEARYLHAFVKTKDFMDKCRVQMTGSVGHKRVPKDYLLNFPVPVAPLEEQKRIADKLDSVLAKVEAAQSRLDKIPAILKRFRQSVLAAATSGELTKEWREKRDAGSWVTVALKEVASGFNYGSSSKSQKEGDVPVLRMGNLQGGKLDWSDLVYSSDEKEISKYMLEYGDVLFNRTNSPELVGKTAIYRGEKKAIYAGYLIRVKGGDRLNSEFLNLQLNSPHARDYCWKVKTDGVSQSNINAKKLQAYEFALPSVEEQMEIVRHVNELFGHAEAVEKQFHAVKVRLNKLTQSVLKKAFQGELLSISVDSDIEAIENSVEALDA